MTGHDECCPMRGLSRWQAWWQMTVCRCALIGVVRADERAGRKSEVEATARWCRADTAETIAATIEAEDVSDRETDYLNGYADGLQDAARIAREAAQ